VAAAAGSRANVYALVDPQLVVDAEPALQRVLLGVLRASDPDRHRLTVRPGSGTLSYEDRELLWGEQPAGQLPPAATAQKAAERFLRAFAEALRGVKLPEGLTGPSLMPPVRPLELNAVPRQDGGGYDHWLYRAQPALSPHPSERTIDVQGAQVDVRVGAAGAIVGLTSRWRPLTGERVSTPLVQLSPGRDSHGHGGGHGHGGHDGEEPEHRLVYLLEGDGLPQYYLAPYYLVNTGHHAALASASAYSLVVELSVRRREDATGARVTAVILGGSGEYRFAWARYAFDSFEDEGIRELGGGALRRLEDEDGRSFGASTVEVPVGAQVVLVNVKDRRTGAFRHFQQLVYTGPIPPSQAEAAPAVA
jgi:hypothetical protein